MSDWQYTYDPVSKEEWLHQIQTDLLPKDIHAIDAEWWPGEPIMPVHTIEDRSVKITLPRRLFDQAPKIIEWIEPHLAEPEVVNRNILNALTYGANSIIISIKPTFYHGIKRWLEGVFPEMIELGFSVTMATADTIRSLRKEISAEALIHLERSGTDSASVFLNAIDGIFDIDARTYRFIYTFPSEGDWIASSTRIFQLLLEDLNYWTSQGFSQSDFLESCVLRMVPDLNYLKQIIQTRTLHLIWNNLFGTLTNCDEIPDSSYLECHIVSGMVSDPDKYIIMASTSALASALSGVHGICIHQNPGDIIPEYYQRINRNIHHLLSLESEIYKGLDPLGGSFAIDYYTQRWTQKIWNQIIR